MLFLFYICMLSGYFFVFYKFSGFFFSLSSRLFTLFTLTGAQLVKLEIWRLVTHCIFERNIVLFLFALYSVYRSAVLFEPLWGIQEFLRFFGIVQVKLTCLLVLLLSYFFSPQMINKFSQNYTGCYVLLDKEIICFQNKMNTKTPCYAVVYLFNKRNFVDLVIIFSRSYISIDLCGNQG